MDFTLTSDQAAVAGAIDRIAGQFETKPTDFHGFALYGRELEQELDNGGYFDIATIPEMGPLAAALAVERLARLPFTAEIALSMLVVHTTPLVIDAQFSDADKARGMCRREVTPAQLEEFARLLLNIAAAHKRRESSR